MSGLASKLIPHLISGGIVATLSVYLTLTFGPSQAEPELKYVTVDGPSIAALMPDFDLNFFERILTDALEAQQKAVAPGAARGKVSAFCDPVVSAVSNDTLTHDNDGPRRLPSERLDIPEGDVVTVIEAVRISETSWLNPLAKRKVEVFGYTNAGDQFRDLYVAPPAGTIEIGVRDGTTVVQGDRRGWLKPLVTLAEGIFIGVAVGAIMSGGD